MRVGTPPLVSSMTFEAEIPLSRSAMPPLICFEGFGRVCRLTMPAPSTTTFPDLRSIWKQNCEEERLLGVDIDPATQRGILGRLGFNVQGDQVAVLYECDLSRPDGTTMFAEFFRVADGKIKSLNLSYDGTEFRKLSPARLPIP